MSNAPLKNRWNGLRVLFVNDSPLTHIWMRDFENRNSSGAQVDICTCVVDAFTALDQHAASGQPYHAVITDHALPWSRGDQEDFEGGNLFRAGLRERYPKEKVSLITFTETADVAGWEKYDILGAAFNKDQMASLLDQAENIHLRGAGYPDPIRSGKKHELKLDGPTLQLIALGYVRRGIDGD